MAFSSLVECKDNTVPMVVQQCKYMELYRREAQGLGGMVLQKTMKFWSVQ